jgi:uncharacterized lipoprotein YbaY
LRIHTTVLTVILLSGCAQEAPKVPPAPASAPEVTFLDTVEGVEPNSTILEQVEEAQKRNEGGQAARIKRDAAERRSHAP